MLGRFLEVHSDDITKARARPPARRSLVDGQRLTRCMRSDPGRTAGRQVRFHPMQPNVLASCAQDGLVNIYTLTPTLDEEESMESVLNVGQTAEKIGFFGPSGEHFYCTTHVQTFSVWDPMKVGRST